MKKNVASQLIGVQMITIADGTDFTGTITCEVTIDGGTKTASGGTGPTHEGEGFYTYIPTQAETNGDHLGFSFAAALAISSTVQVYTTFPQTVDNNVLAAGSTGFAAIDTVVDLILVDTGTTIPGTITTLDTNVDAILVDTGTTLPASIATVDGNVDSILVDTGTTLPASLATIDTNVDSILVDTAEIGVAGAGLTNLGASGNDWNVGKTGYSLLSTGLDLVPVDGTFLTAVEDQVWDAVLTGSSHNDATSSGKRLRVLSGTVFTDGTAQSGGVAGTNTFRLAVGDITTDDLYERAKILIIDGAGVGQEVIITSSTASDDSVTITPAWIVTTDSSSVYEVVPGQTHSTIRNGGYDGGYIYLDVTNGVAGTVKGVNGTTTNPSSNIADATTIAGMENIRKFKVDGGGSITLASTYSHWLFDVVNAALLDLGSQDIGGSVFMRTGITGTGTGTDRVVFELCGMSTATVSTCNFLQCGFTGTTTLSSETSYLAWNCFENAATLPIIDMAGDGITATTLELVGYNGRIQINTLTSTDALIVTGDCHLTLDSTCTGGTITIAGDVKVTDNSSGTTIVQANLADILVDTTAGGAGPWTTGSGGDATAANQTIIINELANGADGLTALKTGIDAIPTTAMRGTDDAALASKQDTMETTLNDVPTTAEFEARTPSASELAYMVANSATAVPVTITTAGGSTTAAVLNQVDGAGASATNDQYKGRLLVFNLGTLDHVVTDITAYNGTTKVATITAIPVAPTASHTARLV